MTPGKTQDQIFSSAHSGWSEFIQMTQKSYYELVGIVL